jgi:hypothetical protein
MVYSLLQNEFREIRDIPTFASKEKLWDDCIQNQISSTAKITYIEFGVHKGYSMEYFAKRNRNKDSLFIGLDSFEGLPEDWGSIIKKGAFNTNDIMPDIKDNRISFIKGWFQSTSSRLYSRLAGTKIENLIVHYDADLYSSTLFALSKIDTLDMRYLAIFDEFAGHETRALYNYRQAYNASVSFLSKTVNPQSLPIQLACYITPYRRDNHPPGSD